MAQLIYTTSQGKESIIDMPSKTGFTARIVFWTPLSEEDEQETKKHVTRASISTLDQQGDHWIFDRGSHHLVVIVQRKEQTQSHQEGEPHIFNVVLIHRSRHEWIVITEGATQIVIDGQPVTFMKNLHHAMKIKIGKLEISFQDVSRTRISNNSLPDIVGKICPYCQSPFQVGDEIVRCPSCGTLQHTECWEEYGGRCSGPSGCRYGVKLSQMW